VGGRLSQGSCIRIGVSGRLIVCGVTLMLDSSSADSNRFSGYHNTITIHHRTSQTTRARCAGTSGCLRGFFSTRLSKVSVCCAVCAASSPEACHTAYLFCPALCVCLCNGYLDVPVHDVLGVHVGHPLQQTHEQGTSIPLRVHVLTSTERHTEETRREQSEPRQREVKGGREKG
jgi:hypothetical protein